MIQRSFHCEDQVNFSSTSDDFSIEWVDQKVRQNITATNKIWGHSKVVYDAADHVLLSPGFEAKAEIGAVFTAKIGGCSE